MTDTSRLRVLAAEALAMADRFEELRGLLGVGNDDVSRLLAVLEATPQQCEMIGFMLRRALATRVSMYVLLFGARPDRDQPEMKLVDVQMVKVRKALEKVGIEVRTEWGSGGWALTGADKAKLRRMMSECDPLPVERNVSSAVSETTGARCGVG